MSQEMSDDNECANVYKPENSQNPSPKGVAVPRQESRIDEISPSNDGDIPETPLPHEDIHWKNIPSERKTNVTSFIVCLLTAIGIIVYSSIEKKEYMYKERNTTCSHKNEFILYTREEHDTYPGFFNLGLGLLGIILGILVDRCCLFLEELRQFKTRYRRNWSEAFKASFSGISWKAVVTVACIIIAACLLGRKTKIKVADAIYILGGIGVGPLLIHLLNLNTESNITVSKILERKKMYPGYTLAWSYYYNTLMKEAENFSAKVLQTGKSKELFLDRMILLLVPGTDITNVDDLIRYDEMIEKLDTSDENDEFPIYKFKRYAYEHSFVMKCVREPIVALRKMKESKKVAFVDDRSYADELKRFYKTLTEILEDAPDDICTRKGLVVPVTVRVGNYKKLNHGGLAGIIMAEVNNSLLESNDVNRKNKRKIPTYESTSERQPLLQGAQAQTQTLDGRPSINN